MSTKNNPVRILPTETYFALVRQQLSDTGQAYVNVTGVSMMPLLRHLRDGVILEPPRVIRVGDIVLFDRRNGRYALHRVIRKGKTGFTMAGDHQWHLERNLPYDRVIGVVTAVVRNGRRISVENFFIKTYAWAVTCAAFPRIYIRKAVGKLIGPIRKPGKERADENQTGISPSGSVGRSRDHRGGQ
jgi:hypothetical protein